MIITPTQKQLLEISAKDFDFTGLDEFYSQAWFRRLWVVQKVAHACEVHVYCGKHEITCKDFFLAAGI